MITVRSLDEMKEFFKDVHQSWLDNHSDKGKTHEEVRLFMMDEMLSYIYPDFKTVKTKWIQESLNEYYAAKKEA